MQGRDNTIMSDIEVLEKNIIQSDLIEDPVINQDRTCIDGDNIYYDCSLSDDLSCINGYTQDGLKAKYVFKDHRWYIGHEISALNLITFRELNPELHKEYSSKGGKNCWENIKQKQTLNEIARELLEVDMSEKAINDVLGDAKDILGDRRTTGAVIMVKMMQTAMSGSFKAAEFVRDTAGYKPKNELTVEGEIITDTDRSLMDKIGKRLELTG